MHNNLSFLRPVLFFCGFVGYLAGGVALAAQGNAQDASGGVKVHSPQLLAPTVVFEHAQFLRSDAAIPPQDKASWEQVQLPHDWRLLPQGKRNDVGWDRIGFDLGRLPANGQALYLRNLRSWSLELFVNGTRLAGSDDFVPPRSAQDYSTPFYVFIPAAMLRTGENVLYVRLNGSSLARNLHGLDRVHFGDAVRLSERQRSDLGLADGSRKLAMAAMFTAGFIALLLWWARRRERVMFWFGIACLSWPLAGLTTTLHWLDVQWIHEVSSVYVRFGLPVPVLILCLRTVDRRWPRFEAMLWVYLALEVTYFLWTPAVSPGITGHWIARVAWPTFSALLLFAGAALIAVAAKRPLRWSHYLEMAGLVAMGAFLLQDLARYMNWVDLSPLIVRHWHAPIMIVALGVAIFERHVAKLWQIERMNEDLEKRLAEKALEIEAHYAREQEIRKTAALAQERQRILEDMHDGLGASLISLLHNVRSGHADSRSLEQSVQDALQEMRVAVDALQPRDGDLGAVLGSLRYRLDKTIVSTGVQLSWEVDELPKVEALEPWAVLSIQRIALEAITNAVRHSGAKRLRFAARRSNDHVEILIEDDGRGFDAANTPAGHGLRSMRARAARLGGRIDIVSAPGSGTSVRLVLPLLLPRGDNQTTTNGAFEAAPIAA